MEFCSQLAIAENAPLYGTVDDKARVWVLIEYHRQWQKGVAKTGAGLPQFLVDWLSVQKAAVAGLRPLLIKKAQRSSDTTVYVIVPDAVAPRQFQFRLGALDDIQSIDVAKIIADDDPLLHSAEKIVAVCTNGLHDNCCSKFGLPVYDAFNKESGLDVWQSSHIGGHRYAATAVVFPTGVYYGYLSPAKVTSVANEIRSDNIFVPHFRGRSYQSKVVNAADYFLRNAIGVTAAHAVVLQSVTDTAAGTDVVFQISGALHTVTIASKKIDAVLASCGGPEKPGMQYSLLAHHPS